jgi:RNA polymerase sigma-70 factor (ECF subfamily)
MTCENELVAPAAAGDRDAFEQLVEKYQDMVFSHALRMCGNRADAEDISQEVFIRLYRSLSTFRGEAALSTWIYSVTANLCIDFARKSLRRRTWPFSAYENEEGELIFDLPDSSSLPENVFEKIELASEIAEALMILKPAFRQIIVLRDINGLSYEEIAAALKIPVGTVRSRLARARAKLCDILKKAGISP